MTNPIQAPASMRKTPVLKLSLLTAALAAAASHGAWAQETTAGQTVVVQGQRASLMKAQDIKRNAEQIVDSIVADDIGKLPDANVAEALQRISGVQISRNRGEGDRVQVRGLQQTQTLLNGRVIFSAGKERGLSFQDVPSELLAGADVYKTPTAEQVEGGIGGVIDLRTRRPFDFAGAKLAGTAKVTSADLADKRNAEGSVLLSNRWRLDAGEFGALLSVSTQKRNYRADTQELDGPAALADGSGVFAPTGQWLAYEFGSRARNAISGALQYRPSASAEYTLDLNHSKLKSRTDLNGFYASPFWANFSSSANQGQLWPNGNITTDDQGRFQKGTFWGASMSSSGSVADEDTSINQLALSGKWKMDGWNLRSELSHTDSSFERFYQEVRLGSFGDSPAFTFDLTSPLPSAFPVGASLSDPGHYWADKVLYFRINNEGRETTWRSDADWSIDQGVISRVRTGVRLSSRNASSAEVNTINDIWMFDLSTVPSVGLISHNDLLKRAGRGTVPTQWLSVTDFDWLRDPEAVRGSFNLGVPNLDPTQTFDYKERSGALYGSADLDSTLAGLPLTGNVGVRVVQTRGSRDYTQDVAGTLVSKSSSQTETDVLPSLNLRLALDTDLIARMALSKVITRPNFDQLTPSLSLNANDKTGFMGNPELGQLSANQLDTSLEYYLSKSDHVYGAAFYNQVAGFIQTTSRQMTIGGTSYTISTPSNGSDGTIRGVELGYQGFFSSLPGVLRGLGLQANYTRVDSSAPSPLTGQKAPLEGLSKNSFNLVGMYDLAGFSARLAYNYRDKYIAGSRLVYPSNDGVTAYTPVTMKGYGMVDAYLSYALTSQIKLAVEGNNLTRTVRRSTYGIDNLPRGTYVDDRRFAVSLHVEL
ncbi:TonB-dependent receptor [Ideonella sp.]|uniref:TonB-dependent receptor n=1 Tax=Ideonella sp. TaxID=1929293 RepID=UPI003BB4D5CD